MQSHLPKIAICEDNLVLRKDMENLIHQSERYELVGSTAYGRDTINLLSSVKVDMLLLDLDLPDVHGLEVLLHKRQIQPKCEAMIVSIFGDENVIISAIENGATGYLLKDESSQNLLETIDAMLAGGSPITPSVAKLLLRRFQDPLTDRSSESLLVSADISWQSTLPGQLPFNWSEREDEVLTYVAKGYSIQEVANLLSLSANTIKTHVRRIYKKLSVTSRSEAVYEARALGLLDRAHTGSLLPSIVNQ